MKREREYSDYVRDIMEYTQKIEKFVGNVDFNDFVKNEEKVLAITHSLQIIGEATKHIPKSVRNQYTHIPWEDIIGMRNFIVHGYFVVDVEIVWKTIKDDLPILENAMKEVLKDLER